MMNKQAEEKKTQRSTHTQRHTCMVADNNKIPKEEKRGKSKNFILSLKIKKKREKSTHTYTPYI